MSLRTKAIAGFSWSFGENIINSISNFLVGIVLARLISPQDFGLVGIAFAFLAFVTVFTDSGFGVSLLQKKDATSNDFSSVFFLNFTFSILFYFLLFGLSPYMADFFDQPRLTLVVRVAALTIIINSLSTIQNIVLTKNVDFKKISIIAISTNIVSGAFALILAYSGYGVWSLVYRALLQSILSLLFYFYFTAWRPQLIFAWHSIRELFSFGSKLLLGNLLDKLFQNAFYFVIGKVYSPAQLGQYSRADMFSKIPSQNLLGVVQKVSFPILVELRGDQDRLLSGYRALIQNTMFISFVAMFCLAGAAESVVISLIGEIWRPSILYLQLLCFSAVLFPLHALNLNMITIHGRSDIVLKLEVWKKIMLIPVVMLGIFYSIDAMLYGMIVFSITAYFLNAFYATQFVRYPISRQLLDLLPSLLLACLTGGLVFLISFISFGNYFITFSIQSVVAIFVLVMMGELTKVVPYRQLKEIILSKVFNR